MAVDPLILHFGEVPLDGRGRGRIQVRNEGHAPLVLASLASASPFSLELDEQQLAPGESRDLLMEFRPRELGRAAGQVVLRSNDPITPRVVVRFDGEGVGYVPLASVEVAPVALDFGAVEPGSASERWLQVRNTGDHPLQVTSAAADGPFRPRLEGRRVHPGRYAILPVVYEPRGAGEHTARLQLLTNDPEHPELEVALRGVAGRPGDGGSQAARPWWGGVSGRGGADAAEPEATPSDAEVLPELAAGPIEPSSRVALGSYMSGIEDVHVAAVEFDPARRKLLVRDLELPTIDAALGEYFHFEPATLELDLRPDGSASGELALTLVDRESQPIPITLPVTTGELAIDQGGQRSALEGRPLSDGRIGLRSAAVFTSGPLQGHPLRLELDLSLPTEEAQ